MQFVILSHNNLECQIETQLRKVLLCSCVTFLQLRNAQKDSRGLEKVCRWCTSTLFTSEFFCFARACVCFLFFISRLWCFRNKLRCYARMRRNINDYDFTLGDIADGWYHMWALHQHQKADGRIFTLWCFNFFFVKSQEMQFSFSSLSLSPPVRGHKKTCPWARLELIKKSHWRKGKTRGRKKFV